MENESQRRLICLYRLLQRYSDVEHPVSTQELIEMMDKQYQIKMHRATVPKDIAILNSSGVEIMEIRTRHKEYYLNSRAFEIPELKLLIDAVLSSKFIPEKKSRELVRKLTGLTSEAGAKKLRRSLYISGSAKSDNKMSYYIVDAINDAIHEGKKISFRYTEYNGKKEKVLRNNGEPYVVSPYALIWNEDYYYALGLNHRSGKINTFRVDRIYRQPEILDEAAAPQPEDLDIQAFIREVFRMYNAADAVEVSLLCENWLMKHVIDEFGMDIWTETVDEGHFRAKVMVCASATFFRWVFGWGGKMKIESPADVLAGYRGMAQEALNSTTTG